MTVKMATKNVAGGVRECYAFDKKQTLRTIVALHFDDDEVQLRFTVDGFIDLWVPLSEPKNKPKFARFCRKLRDGDVVKPFTLGKLTIAEEGSDVSFSYASGLEFQVPRSAVATLLTGLPKAWK